jgi:hypothetical protein
MMPKISQSVLYHSYGSPDGKYKSEPRAAVVTAIPPAADGTPGDGSVVSLAVLNPTGLFFDVAVPVAPEPRPGHWTWPRA